MMPLRPEAPGGRRIDGKRLGAEIEITEIEITEAIEKTKPQIKMVKAATRLDPVKMKNPELRQAFEEWMIAFEFDDAWDIDKMVDMFNDRVKTGREIFANTSVRPKKKWIRSY